MDELKNYKDESYLERVSENSRLVRWLLRLIKKLKGDKNKHGK